MNILLFHSLWGFKNKATDKYLQKLKAFCAAVEMPKRGSTKVTFVNKMKETTAESYTLRV